MGVAVHGVADSGVSMVHQRTVRPTQPGELGPQANARVGWLLMESPSVLIPIGVFIYLRGWESTAITVFF